MRQQRQLWLHCCPIALPYHCPSSPCLYLALPFPSCPRPLLPYALPSLTSTCLALPSAVLPLPRPVWPCLAFLLALPHLALFLSPSTHLSHCALCTCHRNHMQYTLQLPCSSRGAAGQQWSREGSQTRHHWAINWCFSFH